MLEKRFPNGFYWGAATSSYQVEGGIENNDWAEAARAKRVPPCGKTCDHYHRYEEDFDIAKELGHTAHRLSIEWSRIEPEEGKFDDGAIEHYRAVLRALRARGLEPYVTIWHFWLPLWFSESGGFKRHDAPAIFACYAGYVVEKLGDLATNFATLNEPYSLVINGYIRGIWPPFKAFPIMTMVDLPNGNVTEQKPHTNWWALFDLFSVTKCLAKAHNLAYESIKRQHPEVNLSVVFQVYVWESNRNPINQLAAAFMKWAMNTYFMNMVAKYCDSIGVNHYFYRRLGGAPKRSVSDTGWELYPEKIYDCLKLLSRYDKPLYVAEVGVADEKDVLRAKYIKDALKGVHQAIVEGVDVRAFFYWSLLDNYELALGFDKRFGLIEVDYDTLERKIRPSAYVYKEIIERNGIVE